MKKNSAVVSLLLLFINISTAHAYTLPVQSRESVRIQRTAPLTKHDETVLSRNRLKLDANETHVLFKQSQEAIVWAQQALPALSASMQASKFDIVPVTDPRYSILQNYVDELWGAFEVLFPAYTKGLNKPPVILIDSEVANAFVPKHIIQSDKIAHTVIILTALLDKVGGVHNPDLITGMLAHELAHSVFRHALPAYQEHVTKFFNSKLHSVGYLAPRDSTLDQSLINWKNAAGMIGDLSADELINLPSQAVMPSALMRVWIEITKGEFSSSPVCWQAVDAFEIWKSYQRYSEFNSSYQILDIDKIALNEASKNLILKTEECLKGKKVSFIEYFAKATGLPVAALETQPEFVEMDKDFMAASSPLAGFQSIIQPIRTEMLKIETNHNFEEIGYFTQEEHADDISLIVHRYLSLKSTSLSDLFKLILKSSDVTRCNSLIATKQVPETGTFSDPHRSTCFRIYHLDLMDRLISTQDITNFAHQYVLKTMEN